MKKLILYAFVIIATGQGFSQQNPKISKTELLESAQDPKQTRQVLKQAEKHYKQGSGAREEALYYYSKLLPALGQSDAFNYKMGVCYFESPNAAKALSYLQQCTPTITNDYYYQLGKAYMHVLAYDSASVAFDRYYQSLSWFKQVSFQPIYEQLIKECRFASTAVQDSLPYFIRNMGSAVNSPYPDYSAVEVAMNDTSIYFTSRRPSQPDSKFKPYHRYQESVYQVSQKNGKPLNGLTQPKAFQSRKHSSIVGYDSTEKKIFYYLGKYQFGNISQASFKEQKIKKVKPLKGKVNHLAYKETGFTQDMYGNAYFVSNRLGGEGGKDIYMCVKTGKNRYRKVQNMGPLVNTSFDEEGVHVTADGKTLYFSSNGHRGFGGFDVYKLEKMTDGRWSEPINLGYPINSPADELFYKPTSDSLVALLTTTRPDALGHYDIYRVVKDIRVPFSVTGQVTNNKTQQPLSGNIQVLNPQLQHMVQSVSIDSLTGTYSVHFKDYTPLVLQTDVPGYQTAMFDIPKPEQRHELFRLNFELEKLKYPITLSGKVFDHLNANPIGAQLLFRGADSDSVLFRTYSSEHTGTYRITFPDKMNLVMEVVANDYLTTREVIALKQHTANETTLDLALTPIKQNVLIKGKVTELNSNKPIAANVHILSANGETQLGYARCDTTTGQYNVTAEGKGPFMALVSAEGYFFANIPLQISLDSLIIEQDFELQPMTKGVKIVIENILFNSGKASIMQQSYKELDKLANLLLENPTIRIEVSGHTDNVGSSASNKKLSKERALSVKTYLHSKGVPQGNVEYEGYGFDQPIADNKTAEGKAKNRRVEIKVLE
jgi:outer membrane protein OmpA-like peptidoglycan-associated protein/tetratricopeptide (TPR) repeat protein